MPATNRSSKKPSSSQAQKRSPHKRGNKGWVAGVKTVSTLPPKALFTKDAHTIAKSLASKKVSPKGPGSGMRMLTYFMNRAGRGLSPSRRKVLERAKRILSQRRERQKIHERLIGAAGFIKRYCQRSILPFEVATPAFPRHPGCP